jgi:hypothetical protein
MTVFAIRRDWPACRAYLPWNPEERGMFSAAVQNEDAHAFN